MDAANPLFGISGQLPETTPAAKPFYAPAPVERVDARPRKLSRFCGRQVEEARFNHFVVSSFAQNTARPLFCLLVGEASENRRSFVERVTEIALREEAALRWGEAQSVVHLSAPLVWPSQDIPEARQKELLLSLSAALNFGFTEGLTADELRRQARAKKLDVVVLHHVIDAAQWDAQTAALLNWYLNFWQEGANAEARPQFVIFLDVNLADEIVNGRRLNAWRRFRAGRNKTRVLKFLTEGLKRRLSALPHLVLRDFGRVTKDEAREWFSRFTTLSGPQLEAQIEQIFPVLQPRRSLQKVENHLEELSPHYLKEGPIVDDVRKRFRALRRGWQHAGRT